MGTKQLPKGLHCSHLTITTTSLPSQEEDKALLPLLTAHLTYKPGVGAKHFALRAYADAGADKLRLFMRKEGCQVNACVVAVAVWFLLFSIAAV